jgi:tetratricopeptide (TPR) repeat protein
MRKIRIFVSSPGDVGEERAIAHRVIERLRFRYAARADLEVLLWEHLPLVATKSFQEQIPNAGEFDLVVMVVWSRMGTRLPESIQREDGSRYESGTEYEFEQALEASRKKGLPSLIVYRKTARVLVELSAQESDLLELTRQKKSVEAFIDRWFKSPDGSFHAAFHPFESSAQFEDLLERHLRGLIDGKIGARAPGAAAAASQPLWDQGSPFRGLERFDFEHGMIYFGRTAAANDVLNALRQQAAAGCPFVLVFGKSGVGKSSFVRAGVLPLLCDPGVIEGIRHWRRAIFEPSDSTGDSLDGLAAALFTDTALPELKEATTEDELAKLLRISPEAAIPLIRSTLNAISKASGQARLVLAIDPLEEIYSRPGATHEDRERFIAALAALAKSGLVWVIGTMRSDFYERCGELPGLLALKAGSGQYHLAPPTSAEISRMIRLPAQLAGLAFEEDEKEGPLEDVLKDAAAEDPAGLPLLQFALDEIYKRSKAAEMGLLTFAAYRELGGIHGAIRTRAEETIAEVEKQLGDRLPKTFANVFSLLVGVNQVTEHSVVRRYAYLDRITADTDRRALVDALIAARLFMTDIDDENRPVVTLAHEALLHHWPRLHHWIEENRDFLRIRGRVAAAAARWREESREPAYLLSEGKPLAEAEHLLAQHRGELAPDSIEYIEASSAAVAALRLRARQRNRRIIVTISTALVAAVIFGIVSFFQFREANRQRKIADKNAADAIEHEQVAIKNATEASAQRESATKRARAAQELIEFLLDDLRESLAPENARDAKLIATISQQVVDHYHQLDSQRDTPEVKLEHANKLLGVANIFRKMARFEEAANLAQISLDLRQEARSAPDKNLLETLDLLGTCHNQLGHYSQAEKFYLQAIDETEKLPEETAARTGRATGRLAEFYRQMGRYVESDNLHRQAISRAQEKLPPDDLDLAMRLSDYGELLRYRGRLEESATYLDKALAIAAREPVRDAGRLAEIRSNRGVLLAEQGQHAEAKAVLQQTLAGSIKAFGEQNQIVAADRYKLARVMIVLKEWEGEEGAESLLAKSEDLLTRVLGEGHLRTAKCFEAIAELRLAQGRHDAAADYALRVLTIREKTLTAPHPEIINTLQQLARIETARGKTDAASSYESRATEMTASHSARESAAEARLAGK